MIHGIGVGIALGVGVGLLYTGLADRRTEVVIAGAICMGIGWGISG